MKLFCWKLLLLFMFSNFMCNAPSKDKKLGVAGTTLEVRIDPVSRGHLHYDKKTVATLVKGDTFEILKTDRDYDFFTFYKVETKDKVKGYLFEGDTFTVIEPHN